MTRLDVHTHNTDVVMTLFELHTYLKNAGFERWGVSPSRIYTKNSANQTPLEYLSSNFSVDGLKALAVTNYQFDHKDAYSGEAPSLSVITSENPLAIDVLDVLFDQGLSVNLTDAQGNTGLHICCEHSLKQEAIYLISQGVNYTAKNEHGETAFDCIPVAAEGFMIPALDKAIKARKKHGFSGMKAISSLFSSNPVYQKQKKANE